MPGTTSFDFGSPVSRDRAPTVGSAVHHPPHSRSVRDSATVAGMDESGLSVGENTGSSAHDPLHHQRSAIPVDNPDQDRRGSTISRRTTASMSNGMRHRRPARSNTVTTYHETPEHEAFMQPGAEPGIDTAAEDDRLPAHLTNLKTNCEIHMTDFSDIDLRHSEANNESLPLLLAQPRPSHLPCRWISVNGLSWDVIKALGNKYSLHRLAIEDLIHTHTRTKVDWYADHAFVVLTLQKLVRLHTHKGREGMCDCMKAEPDGGNCDRDGKTTFQGSGSSKEHWWQQSKGKTSDMLPRYVEKDGDGKLEEFVQAHSGVSAETPIKPIRTLHRYESAQIPEHTAFMEKHSVLADENLAVSVEQVSIFLLSDNTIISFFEHSAEDVELPLLERLHSTETMLRRSCDASLMLQALIDAIVDLAVPVKDAYNKARKELQVDAMTNPDIKTSRQLHIFGEELDLLQNLFKPITRLQQQQQQQQQRRNTDQVPVERHDTERARSNLPLYLRKTSELRKTTPRHAAAETATSVSISPLAHTYFGDVLDHCITMIQTMEQMDASSQNTSTLIFNTMGAKTNEGVMLLALVTLVFAPLTTISGYFGMNLVRICVHVSLWDFVLTFGVVRIAFLALECLAKGLPRRAATTPLTQDLHTLHFRPYTS
ncbi:hypothetical protein LTR32_007236 [Rachicladosporium monterosium]|uniref:Magnesium transporter n=1 Tax=Rachicladosporium monterosium TaxID=1507873 RepID=A0ABR0KWM9_9PEZI|nr:hypothetical protein LTR32_007236 [Rachicladosporium monterosium]